MTEKKIFIINKKNHFYRLIYLLMMMNIPNLTFNRIYEFLGWEDHMLLCTINQGQKYEQDIHAIEVRLMISNI